MVAQNQEQAWPSWRQAWAWVISGKSMITVIYPTLGASWVALLLENLLASARDLRHMGSIPGSGRSPGGGRDNPVQYSRLETIPWTEEPGELQFIGLQREGHN